MPDKQPETPETDAELVEDFDHWLVEDPLSQLEEFISQAPQLLRTKSLEFLREHKARVDARLAAEPVNWVFSMSDPHEIRVGYWYKIADSFEAEINLRSIVSAQGAPGCVADNPLRPGAEKQPMVAARRVILRRNPSAVERKETTNRALVDNYIEEVLQGTGKRITRKEIWTKAGYKSRTEFERWERGDSKHPNKAAVKSFSRILREKPHLK